MAACEGGGEAESTRARRPSVLRRLTAAAPRLPQDFQLSEERRAALREQIAVAATQVLQEPEERLGSLRHLLAFASHPDPEARPPPAECRGPGGAAEQGLLEENSAAGRGSSSSRTGLGSCPASQRSIGP